ncbi:MAG: hypothetical protein ACO1RT_20770 [Planctomycetaceae bacterium]
MLPSTASAVNFLTTNDLGVLAAPGSLPSAVLYRNGVSSGVTVTVTNVSTGLYKAAFTTGAWAAGDVLQLLVTASIDGTSYTAIAWDGEITSSSGGLDAAGVRAAVGLASANLDTQLGAIDDFLDTEVAAIKAKTDNLPSDPADASVIAGLISGLDTKLDTIDDLLDTEVAAIKAKTDQLTFTTANQVDANALSGGGGGGGLDAAGVRAAVGLASANLDTQLAGINTNIDAVDTSVGAVATQATTIAGYLDTEIAAIKAQTDQFVFTVAGQVDANALSGGGSGLDAAGVRAAIGMASANLDTQLGAIDDSIVAGVLAGLTEITLNFSSSVVLGDDDSLEVIQGDDYTDRPLTINIDSEDDLSAYQFIIAARPQSGSGDSFALRMPIEGAAGEHFATFDPPSTLTEQWAAGDYDLRYRIQIAANKYHTLKSGRLTVRPFDTPEPPTDI